MLITSAPSHELAPTDADDDGELRRVIAWDQRASAAIADGLPHPAWLTRAIAALSTTGNYGVAWIALGLFAGVAGDSSGPAQGIRRFVYVAAAVGACELITYLIKLQFRRRRPAVHDPGEPDRIRLPVSSSFPSSHASMSVVGALTLSVLEPAWWPAFAALAVFYAFSRVYLRVHYVLDVAAGLALGLVLGLPYVLLVKP